MGAAAHGGVQPAGRLLSPPSLPGQKPLNPETACALFCGLSWLISLVALTLAIYALLPIPAVFYIGMVAAVLVIPLFLLVAALRRRRGSSPAG